MNIQIELLIKIHLGITLVLYTGKLQASDISDLGLGVHQPNALAVYRVHC